MSNVTSNINAIRLTITGFPPGPNIRMHHLKRYQTNQNWKQEAFYLAKQTGLRVNGKANLHYHFATGDNRRHDLDNLIASMKPCLDGIVAAGVLADDSIDFLSLSASADRTSPRRVEITITDAE